MPAPLQSPPQACDSKAVPLFLKGKELFFGLNQRRGEYGLPGSQGTSAPLPADRSLGALTGASPS